IVRANVLTRFNAILGTMLAVILIVGQPQDGLFGIILVANALIGIIQEIRAKWKLDSLAVLSAPIARVVRDGSLHEVAVEEIVMDHLLQLRTRDPVPPHGLVRRPDRPEAAHSLLPHASDPIHHTPRPPAHPAH